MFLAKHILAFSAIAVLCSWTVAAASQDQPMPATKVTTSTRLFNLLRRMGEIERPSVHVSKGTVPKVCFCWKFKQPQPDAEERLRSALRLFTGDLEWNLEIRADGDCIVSAPRISSFSPLQLRKESGVTDIEVRTFQQQVMSQVFVDANKMADHLAKILNMPGDLEEESKLEIAYKESPEGDASNAPHFIAWAVSDPQQFRKQAKPWSERGNKLDLPLTYGEWEQFMAELRTRPSNSLLLARFEDPYKDVVFGPSELPTLIQECESARAEFKEPVALRFLDKVRKASELASARQMSLYYLAP